MNFSKIANDLSLDIENIDREQSNTKDCQTKNEIFLMPCEENKHKSSSPHSQHKAP